MNKSTLPLLAKETLFQDAIQRDLVTARRVALLELIWNERFLTRDQIIRRLEWQLGKGCFGQSACEDNFYRDMRVVKQAFLAAGFALAYRRGARAKGYFLKNQPVLSSELIQMIQSSFGEVDPRQLEIYQRLSPVEKFKQGSSLSNIAKKAVAFRVQQENPGMSAEEANRVSLQRSYRT